MAGLCSALYAQSAEAVFQKAASALVSQDYAAAERGFQSVLRLEPGNVPALGNLGVVYSKTRRYGLAIETYKKALKIVPGEPFLSLNLGLAYLKEEQYGTALPLFEKLSADPANRQARELLATCQISLGRFDDAVHVLEPLLQEDPANAGNLYMLGIALTRLKHPQEAQAAFAKMMDAAGPAQAGFLMGKAAYETGEFEKAAGFFRKALEADPHLGDAHRELGKTLISLRDTEGAAKELRQAGPEDTEALYYLGAALSETQPAEAIAILSKARQQDPDLWGPLYYLGRIYLDQGRVKDALPLLERAAVLNPEESAIQYQMGKALQKAGRTAEANAAFARVRQLKSRVLDKEVDAVTLVPAH